MKTRTTKNQTVSDALACSDRESHALLSRYQDGELSPGAGQKVASHLKTCSACREELASLEQVTTDIKSLQPIDTSLNFNAVLMDKVMQKQKGIRQWRFGYSFPSVVYSIVFIVFLALGFWMNGELTLKTTAGDQAATMESTTQQISQTNQLTGLLNQSQDLRFIQVQEQTLALLTLNDIDKGDGNE